MELEKSWYWLQVNHCTGKQHTWLFAEKVALRYLCSRSPLTPNHCPAQQQQDGLGLQGWINFAERVNKSSTKLLFMKAQNSGTGRLSSEDRGWQEVEEAGI